MAVPAIVIKLGTIVVTDKRLRNAVVIAIAAVLSPLILAVFAIITAITGVTSANINILDCCFTDMEISSDLTDKQRNDIENMRLWLSELDTAINDYTADSLDENKVKAVFFCIRFGSEQNSNSIKYDEFIECIDKADVFDYNSLEQALHDCAPDAIIIPNSITQIKNVYTYLTDKGG